MHPFLNHVLQLVVRIRLRHLDRLRRPTEFLIDANALLGAILFPHAPELLLHALVHLVGEDDYVLDVQVTVLQSLVGFELLGPYWHALFLDDLNHVG